MHIHAAVSQQLVVVQGRAPTVDLSDCVEEAKYLALTNATILV